MGGGIIQIHTTAQVVPNYVTMHSITGCIIFLYHYECV